MYGGTSTDDSLGMPRFQPYKILHSSIIKILHSPMIKILHSSMIKILHSSMIKTIIF